LIVPIPGSASGVRWLGVVGVGKKAFSLLEVVSLVTSKAGTASITGCTMVRNWHANFVGIEDPQFRAGQTFLVIPVPSSASGISGLGVIRVREQTFSVLEVVPLVAGDAISVVSCGIALIRNREANFLLIENPSLRALQTDLVVPVPDPASGISRLGVVGVREETLSVLEVVSLEAGEAGTAGIVASAVV